MTVAELVQHYPKLYHMAEYGTWESIKTQGLLSTSALLDLFEITGSERWRIESCHRPEIIEVRHPRYGSASIRDQKPMSDAGLRRALSGSGMEPRQWYELLNAKTFFWLTWDRLLRLVNAGAYRERAHVVLTVATDELVQAYGPRVRLSPLNSGCTIPFPHPRGAQTFLPLDQFPFQARHKTRSLDNAVVELTIEYAVPDIARFVIRAEYVKGEKIVDLLYQRQ